jgi:hypothetical protein
MMCATALRNSGAARDNMRKGWAGSGRMCGMPIASNWTRPRLRFCADADWRGPLPLLQLPFGQRDRPLRAMLDRRVPVGLGVDGSASNDSGHLLNEARQSLLLQRVIHGAEAMTPREALRLATRGGAQVLGRGDLGNWRRAIAPIWPSGRSMASPAAGRGTRWQG